MPDVGRRASHLGADRHCAFTIQVAALTDAANARVLEAELKAVGFDAYLVEPGADAPDALHRVRVGTFRHAASPHSARYRGSRIISG